MSIPASAASMTASSLEALTASRALQGIGSAGFLAVNSALVRLVYPSGMLPRGIALTSSVVAASSVAGPPIAAVLLSWGDWHCLFAINITLGLLVVMLGWKVLPPSRPQRPTGPAADWRDGVLNALTFGLLFLGANLSGAVPNGNSNASTVALAIAAMLIGMGAGAYYIGRQRRYEMPLFPIDLLRNSSLSMSVGVATTTYVGYTLSFVSLPFLMIEIWKFDAATAGLVLSAWPAGAIVGAPLSGLAMKRWSSNAVASCGLVLLGAGIACLALLGTEASTESAAWRLALCGIGFGLFLSPNIHLMVTGTPLRRAGAAGGILGTARLAGQAAGGTLLAGICNKTGFSRPGWILALWIPALVTAVAVVLSIIRGSNSGAANG